MVRLLLLSLLAFGFFSGCTTQNGVDTATVKQEPMYVDENTLILFALDAQNRNNSAEAVGYYDLLYKRTKDPIYEEHAMSALMKGGYYNDVTKRLYAKRAANVTLSEQEVRYLIVALIAKNEMALAQTEAMALVEANPTEKNYMMLAEVYRAQQEYIKALATLESAYKLNYSEIVLDKIAVIIYANMNNPYQAIGRIQKHAKNFGYSLLLTKRLAAFYGDQRDEEGLLTTYEQLYKLEPTKENADILIQLYWNLKMMPELTLFLEKTGSNDELLLKIYSADKKFKKAIPIAAKLYEQTGELDYLGQKAIFEYESAENRADKALLDSVISDLSKVVEVKEEGYYLNYLGYCMIEHDRNVTEGIEYVKRALIIEPDSGYFIDSLAWGYYKLGECQKAEALMQQVVKLLGAEDPEVKAHVNAINSCLKRKK